MSLALCHAVCCVSGDLRVAAVEACEKRVGLFGVDAVFIQFVSGEVDELSVTMVVAPVDDGGEDVSVNRVGECEPTHAFPPVCDSRLGIGLVGCGFRPDFREVASGLADEIMSDQSGSSIFSSARGSIESRIHMRERMLMSMTAGPTSLTFVTGVRHLS